MTWSGTDPVENVVTAFSQRFCKFSFPPNGTRGKLCLFSTEVLLVLLDLSITT